jgi:hypothetical protein
MLHYYN